MEKVEGEIYSVLTGQQVLNALDHFSTTPELADDFFLLNMVEYQRVDGRIRDVQLPVLPVAINANKPVTVLADGVVIIHCIAKGGRKVDVELSGEAERDLRPARIRVQQ